MMSQKGDKLFPFVPFVEYLDSIASKEIGQGQRWDLSLNSSLLVVSLAFSVNKQDHLAMRSMVFVLTNLSPVNYKFDNKSLNFVVSSMLNA